MEPGKTINVQNGKATYGAENIIWECNTCDQKYNKYHDKKIINHVNTNRGASQINTNKNGIRGT